MNSPAVAGRRNSIVEKVSIAKRRLSLESSDAVNDTLRKKFAHWTAPSTDGRRLSIDTRSDASISSQGSDSSPVPSSPYLAPQNSFVFITPDNNYIPAAEGATPFVIPSPITQVPCGLEANQVPNGGAFQLGAAPAAYDFLGPPRDASPSLRSRKSGVVRFKSSSGGFPMEPEGTQPQAGAEGLLTSNERMLFQPVGMRFSGGATPVSAGTAADPFADFTWADTTPQN